MARKVQKDIRKSTGIWILLMSIFIVELFFYTWCRVQYVRTGYEISKEADNHQKLITVQNNLKIEFARLKSPKRIAKIAKQQLGLTLPAPEQMMLIP
jgi:cell division protein FtsL